MEHKTDMNITKIDKYKKKCAWWNAKHTWTLLKMKNWTTLLGSKTKLTEHDWKTEQHFYDETQSRHEKYKKAERQFYDGAQNRYEHY